MSRKRDLSPVKRRSERIAGKRQLVEGKRRDQMRLLMLSIQNATHRIRRRVDHPAGYYDHCMMRGWNDWAYGVQVYKYPANARNPAGFFHIARDAKTREWYCAHPDSIVRLTFQIDYGNRTRDEMLQRQMQDYWTVVREASWLD